MPEDEPARDLKPTNSTLAHCELENFMSFVVRPFCSLFTAVAIALPAGASAPATAKVSNLSNSTQLGGWAVQPRTGALSIGIPLGVVPGEIPITVDLGVQTAFRLDRCNLPHAPFHPTGPGLAGGAGVASPTPNPDDPTPPYTYTTLNALRPTYAGFQFGFIRNRWGVTGYLDEPSLTLLEDGTVTESTEPFAEALLLPKAYGFALPSSPTVDASKTHLFFDASASGLSPSAASKVAANLPSGFGTLSTLYKVVMDKDRARVFVSAPALNGWVPVLWLDRFGHSVAFKWTRVASGLPSGISALSSVVATNQRGLGVKLRWADWSDPSTIRDLARVDFLGFAGPSMLVRGYSGLSSSLPIGFTNAFTSDPNLPTTTVIAPVAGGGGLVGRPTEVLVGDPTGLEQPSWSASGSLPSAPPSSVSAASGSVATWIWEMTWDANLAEVTSLTHFPQGQPSAPTRRSAVFTYQNWMGGDTLLGYALHGVIQVDDSDGSGNQHRATWDRTTSGASKPERVIVKDWWPSAGAADHSVALSAFGEDDQPATTALLDASGAPLATTATDGAG